MRNFWENNGWEENDNQLKQLKSSPFFRPFPILPDGNGLFVIRGPRQVGKSCWLKTMLSKSDPKKSFYLSCDTVSDYKELEEILKSIPDRTYIFFDEISFVSEWWRAIKKRLDENSNLRIVLTGSHAFDIKKGMDQMPGRWGAGGEFELLPFDFFEFTEMRKMAGWKINSWAEELEMYFRVGGFPLSILEGGKTGETPTKALETYKRWLLGDLVKIGKSEAYLKEMLLQIAKSTCSTISLQKLAQKTQIGSHNTAQNYIEVLESCFALKTVYAMDPNTGSPKFKKEKKFYFRDPLLYWLAFSWTNNSFPQDSLEKLAEIVAHEHLYRRYKKFGYYSDQKGEVDFYSKGKWAIEVKWKEYAEGLSKAYQNLVIPEKICWTKHNYLKDFPEVE